MLFKCIMAFFATASLSIPFRVPKKYIPCAGITGALGWWIYLLVLDVHMNKVFANFLATIIVAVCAHIMARILKAPVTMFLIPGVIPLVPGAGMYQIAFAVINNNYADATFYFIETLQLAGSIALGIFIVDTILRKS